VPLSPRDYRRHIDALEQFIAACETADAARRRLGDDQAVLALAAPAEFAMKAVGVVPITGPPPMTGGRAVPGLVNALAGSIHYRQSWSDMKGFVFVALSALKEAERQSARRRRNPIWWADRVLKAVLGIPAYLIGLIIGKSTATVNDSSWGVLLRVVSLVASLATIAAAGRGFGIW
jgi:hypothetical protein